MRTSPFSVHGLSEGNSDVEVVDDEVSIGGSLAEQVTIAELESEEIGSGDDIARESSGTLQEPVGKFESLGKIWESRENGLNDGHVEGNGEQGKVGDIHDQDLEATEGAVQLG